MTTSILGESVNPSLESDSDEEWVFSSQSTSTTQQSVAAAQPLGQSTKQQSKKPLKKLTISSASIRTIRANLPKPLANTQQQQQQQLPLQIIKSVNTTTITSRQEQYKPSPPTPPLQTRQVITTPSLQFISDAELQDLCTKMNSQLLVTRLVSVYKNCEIFLKIKEIETQGNTIESMSIESRIKHSLYYSKDSCDFILNALKSLSVYFAENSKNKDLSAKFRRLLAHSFCTALARFLQTPIQHRRSVQQQPEPEMDLITFDDEEEEKLQQEKDMITFDDDNDVVNTATIGYIEVIHTDSSEEEEAESDTEKEEEEEEEEQEQEDPYTLRKDHQIKLINMIDTIPTPIIVYYAMDIYQLVTICSFGCEFDELGGVKLCKALMKHGHYEETIACIRKLSMYPKFPIETLANQFFTAGFGASLFSLVQGQPTLQRELLSFINKQLRFTYAGNLDIVPREYLYDLIDGTDKTQQLSRLRDRKFQKDLMNCGAKILKECDNNLDEKDYYFITLSQQYASLRFILTQRAIQQQEDGGDLSIEASSNFNGLIDLVCENDAVLARLAIKELIDTGDTVASPHFASQYKQQEFYCRYNALPLNHRLLGIVKGEQMSRHRTFFSSSSSSSSSSTKKINTTYYTLPTKAKWIMVDSQKTLIFMKDILSTCNVCGIDTEWVPTFAKNGTVKTALMQIACDVGDVIFLLDLKTIFLSKNLQLFKITEKILQLLFEDDQIIKIAFDFTGDFDLLHSSIPSSKTWQVSHLLDFKSLKTMPTMADPGCSIINGGLAGVTMHFLGVTLNKRQQLSNWEKRPLTEAQALYGACDAYCLLDIYYTLVRLNHPFIQKFKVSPSSIH